MSDAVSSKLRQQLYSPDCSRAVCTSTQLPLIKVPADRLHIHAQSYFSQSAPGQQVRQLAHKTVIAQSPHQVAGPHPAAPPPAQSSSKAAPNSSIAHAQVTFHAPAILLPVSQVMSNAPLPGPALLPSSPWRQTSPHLQAHAAPSTSGTSVIIAKDISQPSLAKALGFADSPRQSPSIGRQAPAAPALPDETAPPHCHHTAIDKRAMESLPQAATAPSQAEQAGAQGEFRPRAPDCPPGAFSQSVLQRLVTQVQIAFANQPAKLDAFLRLAHEYQADHIGKQQLEKQVSALAWHCQGNTWMTWLTAINLSVLGSHK